MGRNYIAWAVVEGNEVDGWSLVRHGTLYPPDLGDTANYGQCLRFFSWFFEWFVINDMDVDYYGAERFIKMKGGAGTASEDINMYLGQMVLPHSRNVRNTDWKSWFKRHVHPDGAPAFFSTPTSHEADASGIALYTAQVLVGRLLKRSESRPSQ